MEDDVLDKPQQAVASVIAELQAFAGTAGSMEMKQVQAALDYLGYAYAVLAERDPPNPAWGY